MSFRSAQIIPPALRDLQELSGAGAARLLAEALTTGLAAGLVIGLLRVIYTWVNRTLTAGFAAGNPDAAGFLGSAAFLLVCGLTAFFVMRAEPLTCGSGIPHVELAMAGRLPMPWKRLLVLKFLGTLASLCGGLSLGRAAPSIQMGAAIGCGVGELWHENGLRPRFLAGGSVAGLTSAFGAPVAGFLFAFEELRCFTVLPLTIFMATAAAGAWATTDLILGLGRIFPVAGPALPSLKDLAPALCCGIACGLVSSLYTRLLMGLTFFADRHLSREIRLILAFSLALVLLYAFPAVMDGLGPGPGALAASPASPLGFLLCLCCLKILFNAVSCASNAPGGLLLPLLAAGSFTGALLSGLAGEAGLLLDPRICVLCGMAGFFAGIVRAPVTAAFLVCETSGCWAALPALLVCAFLSARTARLLHTLPLFTAMRGRSLHALFRSRADGSAPSSEDEKKKA